MIQLRNKCAIFSVLIVFCMLTSCADRTAQEVSRSMKSEAIIPYSEQSNTEVSENTSVMIDNDYETTPSWGGGPYNKPKEFVFNLVFSQDVLIVDYGRSTANVYQAEYQELRPLWEDDWYEIDIGEIQKWCIGNPVMISFDEEKGADYYAVQDHNTSLQNLYSVELIHINTIKDYEEVIRRQGIESDRKVLCWTYRVNEFPRPTELELLNYVRVPPQYIDDLPVYGKCSGCGMDTFECPGVVGPSIIAEEGAVEIARINPSHTCLFDIERRAYSIKDTLQSNISIVDPTTCLEEIKKALMYNPCVDAVNSVDPEKPDMYDVWGKDVEIYCVELSYTALDSSYPRESDETEEEIMQHEVYLVPVWEVYYIVTNPENELTISSGTVMINALTGKSLFSDKYGPGDNIKHN